MGFRKLVGSLTVGILLGARIALADDLQTVYERRLPLIVAGSNSTAAAVQDYLQTLRNDGTWAALDYTTGCDARRSNWPAGDHWIRILAMAAAYYGGVPDADQYVGNADLRAALGKAMGFWFANDFSTIGNGACLDGGGKAGDKCPCGTPGLWNTNWFSNVILVPKLVGQTCLLLRKELTPTEYGNCTLMTARAYTPFYRANPPSYVSGANILDMAAIGLSAALLENNGAGNASRATDAYRRLHNEVVIHPEDRVDGIKPDGSFQQHSGLVYDGNYGKDFTNAVLAMELPAVGTPFQANGTIRDNFAKHIGGSRWMTFANTVTKVMHWDWTAIGRMITFSVKDVQPGAPVNLNVNLTQVRNLGEAWNQTELIRFGTDLADPKPKTANAGKLNGNRFFWNSDYMTHRTKYTVTSVRLLSNRTATSECVNAQNLKGFHLSDGAVYTYTTGAEYEDMFATFDFSLVPGTTTDYGNTPLNCETTLQYGIDTYAGGVSAGDAGVAAMRYINPLTKALSFYKAYIFFADNVQHVLVNSINSTSPAPVFSVLDQRLKSGDVYLDGERVKSGNYCDVDSLWHAGTGYIFPLQQGTEISIDAEKKTGNWSSIGVSTQGQSTKSMFSAWIVHDSANLTAPIEYSVFPNTKSNHDFEDKADRCTPYTVANNNITSAAVDSTRRTLGAAFWKPEGGSLYVPQMGMTITVDKPVVLMMKLTGNGSSKGQMSVADPTHQSTSVSVHIVWASKGHRRNDGQIGHHSSLRRSYSQSEVTLAYELPTGGEAGSTVTKDFSRNN